PGRPSPCHRASEPATPSDARAQAPRTPRTPLPSDRAATTRRICSSSERTAPRPSSRRSARRSRTRLLRGRLLGGRALRLGGGLRGRRSLGSRAALAGVAGASLLGAVQHVDQLARRVRGQLRDVILVLGLAQLLGGGGGDLVPAASALH